MFTLFRVRHTLFMLYLSYPVSWLVTLLVQFVCYFAVRGKTFRKLREMRAEREKADASEEVVS